MIRLISIHGRRRAIPSALLLLWLAGGCGDSPTYQLDPGHIDPASIDTDHTCFDGARVELSRYSTRCERASAKSLVGTVGEGREFSSSEVGKLASVCDEGPGPEVEIYFEHDSLLFDFSRVASPGRFPQAVFEGYVLDVALQAESSILLAATIDTDVSTLDVMPDDIAIDLDHIEVNLAGVYFDDSDVLKIDLLFANAAVGDSSG